VPVFFVAVRKLFSGKPAQPEVESPEHSGEGVGQPT
jgi:hypothetical protein